jgi:hypothetical protein
MSTKVCELLFLSCPLSATRRGRQHYHIKKSLDTVPASSEQRSQLFLTPPPPIPCTGRTISPIHLPFPYLSPQSVSCGEVPELSSNLEAQRIPLLPPLSHLHRSVSDPPSPPERIWDPSLAPLMNLATVSAELLNPTSSSPPPSSPTPAPSNSTPPPQRRPNEKKRKR